MLVCYVDEAGDTGVLPSATSPIQPLFCIAGIVFQADHLAPLTHEFLDLKRRYFPKRLRLNRPRLEQLLVEVKGVDLRTAFRQPDRQKRRHHTGFLDRTLDLVVAHEGLFFGKVFVKPIGVPMDGMAMYTSAVQKICTDFYHLLVQRDEHGIVVLDSRWKAANERTSFSIFTQKYRAQGDPFPRILEAPLFGHSNNHVGLQLADLLVSAFIFPMAAYTYCSGHVTNVHVHPGYAALCARYGQRLRDLQYRYKDLARGYWHGGLVVSDPVGHRNATRLFNHP